MKITDVRVRKITKEGKMKAIVSITIDDEFVVHDIKVIEGEKGLFIAMPSKKATDGEYRDIAHPINQATRENIQRIILERYEAALLEPDDIPVFLFHGKVLLWNKKRSARIALRRKGIMPLKRPAAGGESCKRDSFLPGGIHFIEKAV